MRVRSLGTFLHFTCLLFDQRVDIVDLLVFRNQAAQLLNVPLVKLHLFLHVLQVSPVTLQLAPAPPLLIFSLHGLLLKHCLHLLHLPLVNLAYLPVLVFYRRNGLLLSTVLLL